MQRTWGVKTVGVHSPRVWLFLLLFSILAPSPERRQKVQFADVTKSAGIDWTHENGATAEKYLIETMGGGGAFLDFDRDGWMDIYLVNSGFHERSGRQGTGRNALYRNRGDGTFEDVTIKAGVAGKGYGNGVAVDDYDNDGWPDIYVTNFGPNILYRNRGDGTFEDVTERAGVAVGQWSTSAAFFDMDNDGVLDLFVCIYLDWDYDKNIYCGGKQQGYRTYCHPNYFNAISNVLFKNKGDGTFTDVTLQAGVDARGKGLGVVTGDVDRDGFQDIYVANDAVANFLFRNQGDGTFEETGLISGVAYGVAARPESGMGTDFGDFNGDGRMDLIVTNIDQEMNNLYMNLGDGFFSDVTIANGLGTVALLYSGFGVRFLDYDNDGDLDLMVLNGHVVDNIELYRSGVEFAEPPLLLQNLGHGFINAGAGSGEIWKRKIVGRALAAGDYDNDGDIDLLFVNNGHPPVLLRNDGGNGNSWLGLHLVGTQSNQSAVGAIVTVTTDRGTIVRERHGGGSYQAAHDPRLLVGLGAHKVRAVEIRWPSGITQRLGPPALKTYHLIREE